METVTDTDSSSTKVGVNFDMSVSKDLESQTGFLRVHNDKIEVLSRILERDPPQKRVETRCIDTEKTEVDEP